MNRESVHNYNNAERQEGIEGSTKDKMMKIQKNIQEKINKVKDLNINNSKVKQALQKDIINHYIDLSHYDAIVINQLNVLCYDNYTCEEFLNNFYDADQITLSIQKYRKYCIDQARGTIPKQELQQIVNTGDKEKIQLMLERVFLEPVGKNEMFMFNRMIKNGYTMEDLITTHEQRKEEKFVTLLKRFNKKKGE